MARRLRIFIVRHGHPNFAATHEALKLDLDLAKFARWGRLRNRGTNAAQEGQTGADNHKHSDQRNDDPNDRNPEEHVTSLPVSGPGLGWFGD